MLRARTATPKQGLDLQLYVQVMMRRRALVQRVAAWAQARGGEGSDHYN
jgi:hypothetical protein